ncbi:MAG: hypothetical protein C5B48_00785 [Candidatus Rokuibacteriota bacterium]|nr:MAG: hypothetical protein C5B48_00785 [Candidatus Rokubacteria bacterium]
MSSGACARTESSSWLAPGSGRGTLPRCAATVHDGPPAGDVILVDSSVWVEIFRRKSRLTLASVGDIEEVVTCLPVVQEVLQGFRDERAFRVARDALFAFPIVESPLRAELFEEAITLYRAARRAGLTVRSGVDCLIAACAIRHGLPVAHLDRDFDAIAEVCSLRARNVSAYAWPVERMSHVDH